MRRHLGCPYANKNVFSDRRNSPSSVSGRRSSGIKLFQIHRPPSQFRHQAVPDPQAAVAVPASSCSRSTGRRRSSGVQLFQIHRPASQFRHQAVPDPQAGSGKTPVAKRVWVLGTMHVSTSAECSRGLPW